MDIPFWNNVKSSGTLDGGAHAPHIGYQTPGKTGTRGHIFVDLVPVTRLYLMNLHNFSHVKELMFVAEKIGVDVGLLTKGEANK